MMRFFTLVAVAAASLLSVAFAGGSNRRIQEYRIHIKEGCDFILQAPEGGSIDDDSGPPNGGTGGGYGKHDYFGKYRDLAVGFVCIPKPAEEVCPKELSRWHDVPAEGLPGLYLEHFENINPALGGEAYFSHTNSAVPPPGFSALDFCFGDSTRTLSGTSELAKGRDKRGRDAVLKILKTVRFVDDAALKAPPPPR